MLAPLRSAAQRLGAYQIRQGRAYTRGIGTRNVDATMASASSSITDNLRFVTDQAAQAAARVGGKPPRVVAVSKTKPVEDLMEAYNAGHRDFGENYVQELVGKAAALPADIRWRFIGHLQSNKVKALLEGVPSLSCIETVDSVKLADKLNAAVAAIGRPPLDVMIQVCIDLDRRAAALPRSLTLSLALRSAPLARSLVRSAGQHVGGGEQARARARRGRGCLSPRGDAVWESAPGGADDDRDARLHLATRELSDVGGVSGGGRRGARCGLWRVGALHGDEWRLRTGHRDE